MTDVKRARATGSRTASSRPTIRDVATAANVSTATVSRVLGGSAPVTDELRERVLGATRETGYRGNPAARDLRKGRREVVLLLVPNLGNPFFSTIIEAVGRECSAHGVGVQVLDTRHMELPYATLVSEGRADGVVCFDGALNLNAASDLPLVMACEWAEPGPPECTVDNEGGARLAAEHLIGLGHRHLLHVCGPEGNVLSTARRDAFAEACAKASVALSFASGDFSLASGARAAEVWSNGADRATAVFCASDECALGFMGRVAALGHRVPDDVSVCGFDDIEIAAYGVPPLTTIRQPRERIGTVVARTLLAAMRNEDHQRIVRLPVELVVRDSTGAPA